MALLADQSADVNSNLTTGTGTESAVYTVPGNVPVKVESVVATITNAAATAVTPELTIRDQSGVVIARKAQRTSIPAGDSGTATFALRLDDDGSTSSGVSYTSTVLTDPALLAYWPMFESSGTLSDRGPHGVDLPVATGAPVYGQTGPFPFDTALTSILFTNDAFGITSGSSNLMQYVIPPATPTGFTIEAWIYARSLPPVFWQGIIQGAGALYMTSAYGLQLRTGGNILFNLGDDAAGTLDSVTAINLNEWTYLVAVGSTTEPQALYFNGVLVASDADPQMPDSADVQINIGVFENALGNRGYFDGNICQVALYTEAFDAAKVAAHYAIGLASGA